MVESDGKTILIIFIGAIITLVLLGSIADAVSDQSSTRTTLNETFTTPSADGVTVELTGRTLVTDRPTIINASGFTLGDVTQWFIFDSRLGTDGLLHVSVTANSTSEGLSVAANTTYEYQAAGHAVNNTDRSVILLITLFAALAITLFVIFGFMRNGSLSKLLQSGG